MFGVMLLVHGVDFVSELFDGCVNMAFRTLCSGLEFGIKQMRQFGFANCNGIAASTANIAIIAIIATLPTVGAGALGGRFVLVAGSIAWNFKHSCSEKQRIGKSTNVEKVQGAIVLFRVARATDLLSPGTASSLGASDFGARPG